MKKLLLRRVKEEKDFFEEKQEKAFTKRSVKDIIKEDYNPFKVNDKIYQRRDGLYMKNKVLLEKEVIKKLNFVERILFRKKFIEIYKKGIKRGFNWNNNVR